MKPSRLDALGDGIFAIVMTLLAIEIKVPHLVGEVTNGMLLEVLKDDYALLLSYALSFLVLFTYWRAHHYMASVHIRSINNTFTNINAVFFMFVALVPFTTHLIGTYSHTNIAVVIYALNVVFIGLSVWLMRWYGEHSDEIDNIPLTYRERFRGTVRIMVPVVSSIFAIVISYVHTTTSLALLTFGVLFNFFHSSPGIVARFLNVDYDIPDQASAKNN